MCMVQNSTFILTNATSLAFSFYFSENFIIIVLINVLISISALMLTEKQYTMKEKIKRTIGAFSFGILIVLILKSINYEFFMLGSLASFIFVYGIKETFMILQKFLSTFRKG